VTCSSYTGISEERGIKDSERDSPKENKESGWRGGRDDTFQRGV